MRCAIEVDGPSPKPLRWFSEIEIFLPVRSIIVVTCGGDVVVSGGEIVLSGDCDRVSCGSAVLIISK